MSPTTKQKIVVLGGGVSAMTTAFELTSVPNWQDHYDITIYQMGWRLGGKGASGRNQTMHNRIEEHGLHIWFGFYYNAFNMIQRCYQEMNRPLTQPLATWEEAFKPLNINTLEQNLNGRWDHWLIHFPTNNQTPGQGSELLQPADYLSMALQLLAEAFREYLYNRRHPQHDEDTNGIIGTLLHTLTTELELAGLSFGEKLLQIALHLSQNPDTYDTLLPDQHRHNIIITLLERAIHWLEKHLADDLDKDLNAQRFFILMDFLATNIRGALADHVLTKGFDHLDELDYRAWLKTHNIRDITLHSVLVQYMYDLAFAYENGDIRQPAFAAGVALHCIIRAFLTYKGHYMWRMQAGMGDTIFTPLYQVLKARGVKFHFFHRVKKLTLSPDGKSISQIIIGQQATITDAQQTHGGYNPLITVKGLPCWPAEPLYDQLVEGKALKKRHTVAGQELPKYNLESYWTPWQDVAEVTLTAGEDFDDIVLGISQPALRTICADLIEQNTQWQNMMTFVKSNQTQAFQIWFRPDIAGMGWPYWRTEPPIMSEYNVDVPPAQAGLNTWSDMTQVLIRECWPDDHYPNQISYFCGPLLGPGLENLPPSDDHEFPWQQFRRVKENSLLLLNNYMRHFWPKAIRPTPTHPNGLDWELVVDPLKREGIKRFDAQFWRANIDPTERYVLSVPGSTKYRMRTDETGFENLFVTGDWIYNGLNVGCVESAVMSGMLTSQAITRRYLGKPFPEKVVGGPNWWA
ncbi:MAG: hypothetical protein D6706_17445 [Chloroflexi bacterium]|nr:MAG: hypothetical protein D6706_17445 [Chloroflexota bacterium]